MDGALQAESFVAALGCVIARHNILRAGTRQVPEAPFPVQVVNYSAALNLARRAPRAESEVAAQREELARTPSDLIRKSTL